MNKGKKALLIISAVLLLAALVFVAYVIFRVKEVAVMGCETLEAKAVVDLSGLKYGENIFLLDKQAIMDALSTEPRIKPVGVEVKYPSRVIITVEERMPAAYIEKNGALVVIDNEGWIIDVKTQPVGTERPLVYGLQADAFEVGKPLSSGDMFRVEAMTRVIKAAEDGKIILNSVDVTLAADIVVMLANGLTVELGDDTQLDEKMALVNASVKEIENLGKQSGILDVSSVDKAYFREKSA